MLREPSRGETFTGFHSPPPSRADMPSGDARLNGERRAILAANYAFRAVEVEAGSNRIEMRYRPPGLLLGSGLSALGVLSLLWLGRPGYPGHREGS